MKPVLLLLVALAAGAIIYPRVAERTDTVCAAFEHKVASAAARQVGARQAGARRQAGMLDFLQRAVAGSQGQLAAAYIHDRYPQLPSFVGCAVGYWRVSFDPDLSPLLADVVKGGR
jgi:hypothetical protein